MVIYVYPTPENKYYELPNPRPIQRKKIHFVSPNFPPKIINRIFSRIYFYIHSSTEDRRLLVYWT